jgi:hypothetical protein
MNIGIVCYPTFGGSGVVATELGKALAEKGHQIHFITYSQPVRLDGFKENVFYHEVTATPYALFDYIPYESALTSKLVDVALHEKIRYTSCALCNSSCIGGVYGATDFKNAWTLFANSNNSSWYRYYPCWQGFKL